MSKILQSLTILSFLTFIGCSTPQPPVESNPLWQELELELRFGQPVEIDGRLKAIVIDVTKDEGGIWYGLCFQNENGLFGRQIPNGMIFTTCVDMLDATYLNESAIDLLELSESKSELLNPVRIGSNTPATTLDDLIRSYEFGLTRRELEQTPCDEDIFGLNPVRERYFQISELN
ncbi:MAG: hypothetical protein ABJN36_08490 [Cyclobacteriaceae bacterium]